MPTLFEPTFRIIQWRRKKAQTPPGARRSYFGCEHANMDKPGRLWFLAPVATDRDETTLVVCSKCLAAGPVLKEVIQDDLPSDIRSALRRALGEARGEDFHA